jgi:hypothetical protein
VSIRSGCRALSSSESTSSSVLWGVLLPPEGKELQSASAAHKQNDLAS